MYIKDLPDRLRSTVRLFADDSLLYRVIDSHEDADLLQDDLLELEAWERRWSMEFAEEKCLVLRITRKRKINQIIKPYQIHNFTLKSVDSAKYLGVNLDNKLTFKKHVNDISKRANNTRQFLQRVLLRCNRDTKELAYKTYVRPGVECCATVWDPYGHQKKGQRESIEAVQQKAARFVTSNWREPSTDPLISDLKWDTLEERRARARVTMLFKITHNMVAIPITLFSYTHTNVTTRGAPIKFQIPYCNTHAYSSTFVPSAPLLWNGLPAHMTQTSDLCAFRSSLAGVCLSR